MKDIKMILPSHKKATRVHATNVGFTRIPDITASKRIRFLIVVD
jgi:hypothetical protein